MFRTLLFTSLLLLCTGCHSYKIDGIKVDESPTSFPDEDEQYCQCNYTSLWLDVVFVVDSTDAMGRHGIEDVSAFIQGTLYQLSKGASRFQTRSAIVAYAAKSQIVASFTDFLTDEDVDLLDVPFYGGKDTNVASGIRDAMTLLDEVSSDRVAAQAIVLIATTFRSGSSHDPTRIAETFKENGGTLITINYVQKDGIADPALAALASPSYAYSNQDEAFGNEDLLQAFCDVNCFCSTNQRPFTGASGRRNGTLPLGGCYDLVTLAAVERAAANNCRRRGSTLPSIHSQEKQEFLTSSFPPATPFWIGLQRSGESFSWLDQTRYDYSNFPRDVDVGTGPAFFSKQYSGFRTGWFATSSTASAQYACQLEPCDSTNDACIMKEATGMRRKLMTKEFENY